MTVFETKIDATKASPTSLEMDRPGAKRESGGRRTVKAVAGKGGAIRIGRPSAMPPAAPLEIVATPIQKRVPSELQVQLDDLKDAFRVLQQSRTDQDAMELRIAEIGSKIDAMKDGFDVLEAYVSIGLSKSIGDIVIREVSAAEKSLASRNAYRSRYRVALTMIVLLCGAIAVDAKLPFMQSAFSTMSGYAEQAIGLVL